MAGHLLGKKSIKRAFNPFRLSLAAAVVIKPPKSFFEVSVLRKSSEFLCPNTSRIITSLVSHLAHGNMLIVLDGDFAASSSSAAIKRSRWTLKIS
jgi:beta-lactamase superfamily II metal-dependent hydrolase